MVLFSASSNVILPLTIMVSSFLVVPISSSTVVLDSPVVLDSLRVEYRENPINIDNTNPRFSWIITEPALQQTAYRLTVAYRWDPDTIVYDTGNVSTMVNHVFYNGLALESDTDYVWNLAVQLTTIPMNGTVYNYTNSSLFSTSLLYTDQDWQGNWIGGYNQIRKSFPLSLSNIQRARIYITAVGCYTLYINGQSISQDGYNRTEPASIANPGFSTIYTTRVLYNAYDIGTALIPNGENVIGIRIGSCKYGYLGEFCTGNETECNAVLVQINIQDNNNNVVKIYSNGEDNTWLGIPSPILSNHFYNGEVFDGRNDIPDWSTVLYTPSSSWQPVVPKISPTASLSAHTMPQITGYEVRVPVSVTPITGLPNSYLFDLQLNGAGKCTLTLPAPVTAGITINITYAELLYPNNTVFIQFPCPAACCLDGGNCANQKYTYITNGSMVNESYEPTFAYAGFRYIQVDNWPSSLSSPTINALSCMITSSNVETAGSIYFNSTNGWLLNDIQKAIIRTQRASIHSIPCDCPQREKRGWMADAHVSATEASLNLFMVSIYRNWLRTHLDTLDIGCTPTLPSNWSCPKWQSNQPGETYLSAAMDMDDTTVAYTATSTPSRGNCYLCCTARSGFGCNGDMPNNATNAISDVIPFDKNGYGSYPGSICWTSAFFVIADILLDRYNDIQALISLYPALSAHLQFYTDAAADFNSTLVPYETYGDWNAISYSNKLLMANAYYFHDALIMSKIALALNKTDDAIMFLNLASTVSEDSFNHFFNFSTYSWDTAQQQGAQSIALNMGLGGSAAETYTKNISKALVDNIMNQNIHLDVGTLGTRHILQALTLIGRTDIALALANQTSQPSWGYFVTSPLAMGTFWESWEFQNGGSGSFDHVMFAGGIGCWFYDYALGLHHQYRITRSNPSVETTDKELHDSSCSKFLRYLPSSFLQYVTPLTTMEQCILQNLIHRTRKQLDDGKDKHTIFSKTSIREWIHQERLNSTEKKISSVYDTSSSTVIRSSGRLLLDTTIVKSMGSMFGHIVTLEGNLSTAWTYDKYSLTIDVTFPSGMMDNGIFIPRALLLELQQQTSLEPVKLYISRGTRRTLGTDEQNRIIGTIPIANILDSSIPLPSISDDEQLVFSRVSVTETYEHSVSGSVNRDSESGTIPTNTMDDNNKDDWFALKLSVPASRYNLRIHA